MLQTISQDVDYLLEVRFVQAILNDLNNKFGQLLDVDALITKYENDTMFEADFIVQMPNSDEWIHFIKGNFVGVVHDYSTGLASNVERWLDDQSNFLKFLGAKI